MSNPLVVQTSTASVWARSQFREEEDGPFCTRLLGEAGSRSWGGHAAARKEDVVLPPEGGWQWTSDWQVTPVLLSCRLRLAFLASAPFGRIRPQPVQPLRTCLMSCDLQVETQAGSSDGEGWQYREPSPCGAAEARPANPVGEHGWSARGGPNCNWRRRRWVRHRRRRQHVRFFPVRMLWTIDVSLRSV